MLHCDGCGSRMPYGAACPLLQWRCSGDVGSHLERTRRLTRDVSLLLLKRARRNADSPVERHHQSCDHSTVKTSGEEQQQHQQSVFHLRLPFNGDARCLRYVETCVIYVLHKAASLNC